MIAPVAIAASLLFATAGAALAATPPLELAQRSLAAKRVGSVKYDLSVTQMSEALHEFSLRGEFSYDSKPAQLAGDRFDLKLLWIALLATDPVAELQRVSTNFLNADAATVGVQEEFVYVYGTTPSVSVTRDFTRLAALATQHNGQRWVIRLTWRDGAVTGAMVTRDGRTVLTARTTVR